MNGVVIRRGGRWQDSAGLGAMLSHRWVSPCKVASIRLRNVSSSKAPIGDNGGQGNEISSFSKLAWLAELKAGRRYQTCCRSNRKAAAGVSR